MFATITHKGKEYKVDFYKPIDLSMPLHTGIDCPSAWYVAPMSIEPVKTDTWIGDVNQGGSVNFRDIKFNPHGNGTHTECVGHISKENYTINQCLKKFFFIADLITVLPTILDNGDSVITKKNIELSLLEKKGEAIIIRTLPNGHSKLSQQYSNTNPTYIDADGMKYIVDLGYEHLLIDTPSVDREQDNGILAAHHIFWDYPNNTQLHKTITELIFVPNTILDGTYFLNLQIAAFENDASPSKPVIYNILS
jgi:arylformamidase